MNLKRALAFSILLWVFIFVTWSIVMSIPALKGKMTAQYTIHWVIMIPMVLLLAKWHFKKDPPSAKKGLYLGIFAWIVMSVLDLAITISLFISPQQGGYLLGLKYYYTQWELWSGFAWFLILCVYSGWEFDKTFTKDAGNKQVEVK